MRGNSASGAGAWVFGYGSLVSPVSFGATIERDLVVGVDLLPAVVTGYGRRWNYGVGHLLGRLASAPAGSPADRVLIALGIEAREEETMNGVVAWVAEHELPALDRRERHYDRIEVTAETTVAFDHPLCRRGEPIDGPVVTYQPQPEAIELAEAAGADGSAVVEQRYWDLVAGGFAALGYEDHARYLATTPRPVAPVLPTQRVAP